MALKTEHIFLSWISLTIPDELPLDTLKTSTSRTTSLASILFKYCMEELIATE